MHTESGLFKHTTLKYILRVVSLGRKLVNIPELQPRKLVPSVPVDSVLVCNDRLSRDSVINYFCPASYITPFINIL